MPRCKNSGGDGGRSLEMVRPTTEPPLLAAMKEPHDESMVADEENPTWVWIVYFVGWWAHVNVSMFSPELSALIARR